MAYCSNCNEWRPDEQKFCDTCGTELAQQSPSEQPAEHQAQPEAPPTQQQPTQPPPAQPVQYGPQVQQAVGLFNKLGLGLQIAAIGAIVSFVFSLIIAIQLSTAHFGMFGFRMWSGFGPGTWLYVIAAVAVAALIYLAQMNKGRPKIMMTAGIIALGGMWLPMLLTGWGYGLMVPAMLGGIAEIVGGFVALNEAV